MEGEISKKPYSCMSYHLYIYIYIYIYVCNLYCIYIYLYIYVCVCMCACVCKTCNIYKIFLFKCFSFFKTCFLLKKFSYNPIEKCFYIPIKNAVIFLLKKFSNISIEKYFYIPSAEKF